MDSLFAHWFNAHTSKWREEEDLLFLASWSMIMIYHHHHHHHRIIKVILIGIKTKQKNHHTKHRIQHQSIYSCIDLCSISGHTYIRPHTHTRTVFMFLFMYANNIYTIFRWFECIMHIFVCWLWVFWSLFVFVFRLLTFVLCNAIVF